MTVEQALQFFHAGLAADRTAQSYLVTGQPRGGAGAFATGAAQALFCTAPGPDRAPCGACKACLRVEAHREPDVLWVEPAKKSRIISVGQMREEVLPRLHQTAFGGGWKVVILVHADRLNANAANAFLKTLEEPPPRSLIMLLTDHPEALLPTILSRCQRVAIHTSEAERCRPELEGELESILTLADPKSYLERAARGDRISRLLKRLGDEALAAAGTEDTEDEADKETIEAREAAVRKGVRTDVLQALLRRYRDILVLTVASGSVTLFADDDRRTPLEAVAARTNPRKALADIGRIETLNRQLERNLPEPLVFGRVFAELN